MGAQREVSIDLHFRAPDGSRGRPTLAQHAFLHSPFFVTALIGGYGSGKTEALLRKVMRCLVLYEGYSVILASDTFPHVVGLLTRLCKMGLFPPAYRNQPATARARIFGRRKSPVIASASYEERHIIFAWGSELRWVSGTTPKTAEGLECHLFAWDESTIAHFDETDRDNDAWHIFTSRARQAPMPGWPKGVPHGVLLSSVPRGGECKHHLEGGKPCMAPRTSGLYRGLQICHNVPDRIVIHASTRTNLHNLSPAYQRQIELMNPHDAALVLDGQWLPKGMQLLPGWDRILIPWTPDPTREHHIAVDPGKRTGHALLLEVVQPHDPAYPHSRANGTDPVYVLIEEVRSPAPVPEAFALLCFKQWADYRVSKVILDQAGLQSMHTSKSRAVRRGSRPHGSHVKAWNETMWRLDNRNHIADEVKYTKDKTLTRLETSVPMLADWVMNARGESRYFVADYLKGKDYGRIQDRTGGTLWGVHPQGEEYCRDDWGNIPMKDKGRGHHGIDALRYHRIHMDATPRGTIRGGRSRRGRGV